MKKRMKRVRGFRWGAMVGFGAGYVLGSRAGRERYEELRDAWRRLQQSSLFRQAEEAVRGEHRDASATGPGTEAAAPPGRDAEFANLRGPGVSP